jgi:molybdopterin/thiamine biosynthesis adenylyltransferase
LFRQVRKAHERQEKETFRIHDKWGCLLFAAVFQDELQYKEYGPSWVFGMRASGSFESSNLDEVPNWMHEKESKDGAKKYWNLIREGRYGRKDAWERVPQLSGLEDKTVGIIGLGCVGEPIARELAKSGLGELRLVDCDHVEPGTLSRWDFGLEAAGKNKAAFLGEALGNLHPYTEVQYENIRIGYPRPMTDADVETGESQRKILLELIDGCDLVIDATAESGVQRYLAEVTTGRNMPFIAAWGTKGGWGGGVARLDSSTGCWLCFLNAMSEGDIEPPPGDESGTVQPSGCADPTFTGTHFDLQQVSLEAVRAAASSLLPTKYGKLGWDIAILSLRTASGNLQPASSDVYDLPSHPSCPECGSDRGDGGKET